MGSPLTITANLRRDKTWLINEDQDGNVVMTKEFYGRPVKIRLVKIASKEYHLIFPSYIFRSKISHFTSVENEMRFCRNKVLLFQVLRTLKHTGASQYIQNKQWLKINGDNEDADKNELKEELHNFITGIK